MKQYEVVIAGGGLVGLAAALVMAIRHPSICLVEASDFESAGRAPVSTLDTRSIALSLSSVQIFKALGLWEKLQPLCAPIESVHISSKGYFGITRLDRRQLGLPPFGYVIEYHDLQRVLLTAVRQLKQIELCGSSELTSVDDSSGDWMATEKHSADGVETLQSRLVLVADGAHSRLRDMLGIAAQKLDYQQSAIAANVQIKQPGKGVAYERFTEQGPLALLPLNDQRYALVWTQAQSQSQALIDLSDEAFIDQLHLRFGYRLGRFSAVGRRSVFPLHRVRSTKLVKGGYVLIGNAANALHPVAGQGFNLALRDIATVYDVLQDQAFSDSSVADKLQHYQALRKTDQDRTVNYGHMLVQLFSNEWPILNYLRSAGLAKLDLCSILKAEVSWIGMGFTANPPTLLRGVMP